VHDEEDRTAVVEAARSLAQPWGTISSNLAPRPPGS
jgi:hypothetical protein